MPPSSARVLAISWVTALLIAAGSIAAAEHLSRVVHGVLFRFGGRYLVAWCAALASVAALVAVVRRLPATSGRLRAVLDTQRARGRRLARAITTAGPGAVLPLLVAASFAIRIAHDFGAATPRVFSDELIYTALAKSLAAGDGLEVRGIPGGLNYGPVYPLLTSIAYGVFPNGASAYFAIQALNGLLLSLTAVPAFFLARRILTAGWSFAVAALSVATPAMSYSALVMTEALFYPCFVAAALMLVLTLEHPTRERQALFVGTVLVLSLIRIQAIVLVPAFLTAVLIDSVRRRVPLHTSLRRFGTAWALLGVAVAIALAATRGDLRAPLGAYEVLVRSYAVDDVLEWALWNSATLELSLGIVAAAAFPAAVSLMLRRSASVADAAVGAAALALVSWTILSVAALSASPWGLDRLHWRSLFFVLPLFLCCFAWWLANGLPRPQVPALAGVGLAVALPLTIPDRLVRAEVAIDSPPTQVWRQLMDLTSLSAATVITPLVILGVATFWLARGALFPLISVALAAASVTASIDWISTLSRSQVEHLAWVDAALPARREALLIHATPAGSTCPAEASALRRSELVLLTEFFNASVLRFAYVGRPLGIDGLGSPKLTVRRDGTLLDKAKPVAPSYAILDSRLRLAGQPVARFDADAVFGRDAPDHVPGGSLTLWRVHGRLRLADPLRC